MSVQNTNSSYPLCNKECDRARPSPARCRMLTRSEELLVKRYCYRSPIYRTVNPHGASQAQLKACFICGGIT